MGLGIVSRVIDIKRFVQGVQFQDLAQQMRLAEYRNAIAIICATPSSASALVPVPSLTW